MNDELRTPDPGMRRRRREPGSSVRQYASAPPPVADSYVPEMPVEQQVTTTATDSVPPPTDSAPLAAGPANRAVRSTSDASILRSTGSMAIANLTSRITGFVRMILILAILGPAVASAFNTANTLPNMITELVLGSVLTAMFMPLLARSAREDPDGGVAFIRRLITLTGTLALAATVLAVAVAPLLTTLNLGDGKVNTDLATAFAFLLLPQIFFYGIFSVLLAVLNYQEIFRPGAWAPVWNNLVSIATLLAYRLVLEGLDPNAPVNLLSPEILLLGVGTTAGVALQAIVLLPALRRAGISLRPLWGVDPRLKQFGGSALAGFAYVLISQVGLVMTNRIGAAADEGAIAIYGTHWLLLQVPYGIIGVTLLTAINPRLADNGTAGRTAAVVRDISLGTRLSLLGLLPIVALFTAFGTLVATGLFAYGRFTPDNAHILGLTLSFGAFTLIPYAVVLLQQRVFYARETYWTPTIIIVAVTSVRVIGSLLVPIIATDRAHVVVGLALANGAGWLVGATAGYVLLRRVLGPLGGKAALRTGLWTAGASAVGCTVATAVDRLCRLEAVFSTVGSPGYLIRAAIAAIIAIIITVLILWKSRLSEIDSITPLVASVTRRLRRR